MASLFADITSILMGLVEGFTHNIIGLAIVALVAFLIWMKYGKPKPVNEIEVIFKKEWEATVERLGLPSPKKLLITSWPISTEEIKKMPIHQVHYQPIGNVIGINIASVRNNIYNIIKLSKQFTDSELAKIKLEYADEIKEDKFWVVFAVTRRTGGMFLFPKTLKTLIHCKPKQIIEMNSRDDNIMVRGVGLQSIGPYELIIDKEDTNITIKQLLQDKVDLVFDEITLGTVSKMGTYVEKATQMDTEFRKEVIRQGIPIMQKPESQDVKT
jgi:hypothetical protein